MNDPLPVLIPLLNPNEPEARLVTLAVREGQPVSAGDLLAILETTKSSADLSAEIEGVVAGLRYSEGQTVHAGEILCYLAGSPDWMPPREADVLPTGDRPGQDGAQNGALEPAPEGLRITQPALELARQNALDLSSLPVGPLVTESMVRARLQAASSQAYTPPPGAFDPTRIIVYGGGGHGKILIDLLRASGIYHLAGVIDDGRPAGELIMGLPVLGGRSDLAGLYERGVRLAANGVGGISNIGVRIDVFRSLAEAGFVCPALAHPRAVIERSAHLEAGSQVLALAYVGSEAHIGYGAIVSTGAIVSHDCRLGSYVNISPGAILAGSVQVGSATLIGMGATINLEVKVGAGARIGNGATVKADVPENGIVRAGTVWPA